MRLGMGVGGNTRPIGLIGRPVDEAGVMLWDEDRPFGARQLADLPFAPPGRIERDLTPGFSVNIGARVNRVCQHMINSGIARVDPPDRCTIMGLHREGQALAAQPKPDPTHRTEFGEAREDGADCRGHRRIGVKADFAVLLAPDEATGRPRRSSPRAALLRMPPSKRARKMCNSASLIVPLRPSTSLSLNIAGW